MMRAASIAALFAAFSAHAQCPSEGDCRKPHETPGCVMPECCQLVCKANPLCCEVTWDQACADAAIELCDGISCPSDGACTQPHPNAGCSDYTCCELVTAIDGWCTWASWDEVCARLADQLCAVQPCTIEQGTAIDEQEPCYERMNDGCGVGFFSSRLYPHCTLTFKGRITSGGPRDLDWFSLDAPERRRVRVVLDAEFPVELQYFLGDCEGPNEVKWLLAHPICTGTLVVNFLANDGSGSLILGAGNADASMRNGLDCDEIDPDNPPAPEDPPPQQLFGVRWRASFQCLPIGDIDGDGAVGPQDVALLLNAWGPVPRDRPFDPRQPDADLDGNGEVGAPDIAMLLGSW
ncbi:MAG: hypothetical protein RIT24_1585 [Planctomycetota bacterium]